MRADGSSVVVMEGSGSGSRQWNGGEGTGDGGMDIDDVRRVDIVYDRIFSN